MKILFLAAAVLGAVVVGAQLSQQTDLFNLPSRTVRFDSPELVYVSTNWWAEHGAGTIQRIQETEYVIDVRRGPFYGQTMGTNGPFRFFTQRDVSSNQLRKLKAPSRDDLFRVLGDRGEGGIPSNGYILVQWRLWNTETNNFRAIDAWAGFYVPGPTNYPLFFLFRTGRLQ